MKRIYITLIAAATICAALAVDTIAQQLAAAKAACPNCYRVVNTNGVYVGMNRADYEAYKAAKKAKSEKRNARFHQKRPRIIPYKRHKRSGKGPMPLRRVYIKPSEAR